MSYSFDVITFVTYLWGTILFVGIGFVGYVYFSRYLIYKLKYSRISSGDIYQIDHLDKEQFLVLLKNIFEKSGYVVKRVKHEDKEGEIDFQLIKENEKIALLLKPTHPGYRVGSRAVMQINHANVIYGCTDAIVITNGFFTPHAQKAAIENEMLLFDRDCLLRLLSKSRVKTIHNKKSKAA